MNLFSVPIPRNPLFSERERELSELDRHLTAPQLTKRYPYPVIAVYGLGGVGCVRPELLNLTEKDHLSHHD